MATITAGNSVTLPLGPGGAVTVTIPPNAEGRVVDTPVTIGDSTDLNVPQARTTAFGPVSGVKRFGPYPAGASVTISCSVGSIDYAPEAAAPGVCYSIGQQHTQVVAPTDTAENNLYSITIPGGLIGQNDTVRVSCIASGTGAGTKTWRMYLGAYNLFSAGGANVGLRFSGKVSNRNSSSKQVGQFLNSFGDGGTANVLAEGSVDTSQNVTLRVSCQKATGAEAAALESVLVELIRGA